MRVLVSRLSALGDVVCTLPVAKAIKDKWPESEIVWVVDKRFRGVLECAPSVDSIVERPRHPREVRNLGEFDAALDMQGLLKSSVLVANAKTKVRLGYHWQREGAALLSQAVVPDPSSIHIVDQYVDVARALGADADRADFNLRPLDQDLENVRLKLEGKGVERSGFALMNAGAGWATKRWPAACFAQLAERLQITGTPVVFLGGPGDRPVFDEVRSHGAPNAVSMVGETSVRELVALVSLASVHVGGDTGSTHLAAALNVPAVGVYTLTRLERSCPYGQIQNCFEGRPEVDKVFEMTSNLVKGQK